MTVQTYTPSATLAPFIERYTIVECSGGALNRVFPDTSLVMAFRFKGHVSYTEQGVRKDLSPSVATGLRKSARLIQYLDNSGNVLVKFKEAGAQAFVKEPLHELFGESVAIDNLSGYKDVSFIEEQLAEASSHEHRIRLIERFLTSKLHIYKHDPLVWAALAHIRSARGIIKIKDLTTLLHISVDPFEKRFRRTVGISPKQFSVLVRMQSIIGSGLKEKSLAEIALDAGYFDQAHFTKDFKLFTGQTPTGFLQSPVFW